jgi:cytochrome P450
VGPGEVFPVVHPDHVRRINVEQRDRYGKEASYEGVRRYLLGDGLVASRGALWRRQRRLMAPFFTPRASAAYLPIMAEDAARFGARWSAAARRGEPVDVLAEMSVLTASIIPRSMFSTESGDAVEWLKGSVEKMIGFATRR